MNQYRDLDDFLRKHKTTEKEGITHTRIGNDNGIFAGKYIINDDELDVFHSLYHKKVFIDKKPEYLTEKQFNNNDFSKMLIDLDFRYNNDITERQHTKEDITDIITLYIDKLNQLIQIKNTEFKVFVLEKPNVNTTHKDKDKFTKDGIHFIFNIAVNHKIQQMLRTVLINDKEHGISPLLEHLNLINSYDKVLDFDITTGKTNFQMFGSRKPNNEAYEIKYIYNVMFDNDDETYELEIEDNNDFNMLDILNQITARKLINEKFDIRDNIKQAYLEFDIRTNRIITPTNINKNCFKPISNNIDNEKFWQYAYLWDWNKLRDYNNWIEFTCIHINILGIQDYTNYDLYCKDFIIEGYDETKNKIKYEELLEKSQYVINKVGWKRLIQRAYEASPDKTIEIDKNYNIIEEVMNIHKLIRIKSNIEPNDDLKAKLNVINDLNTQRKKEVEKEKKELFKKMIIDELNKKKNYFEEFHFKVMNPPCFGRLAYNKTSLLNKKELKLIYENIKVDINEEKKKDFIDMWLECEYIKTYEQVDFLPYPKKCESHVFNTFNGLRCERIQANDNEDYEILLKHLKMLSGHDEKGFIYLLNYLAHLIQKPGELPRVALVFQSDQGVGKNVFFESFGRVFLGDEYVLQTAEMEKVIGRFSMINNKLLIIMDETNGKDSFSNSDKIKNIITAEKIAWERKGIDGVNINNCGRYLFFSNNNTPVKIEPSDRRYVVYNCANDFRNNKEYFKKIVKSFNNDNVVKSFYTYLKNIDISNWDSINDRPITEAYKDIKSATIPVSARFLINRIYEYESLELSTDDGFLNKKYMEQIGATEFLNIYKKWLQVNGFSRIEINATTFGREIVRYSGIEKKRTKKEIVYVIDFNILKTYLIKHSLMEELEVIDEL
jgi:putative DNA primase/helicase